MSVLGKRGRDSSGCNNSQSNDPEPQNKRLKPHPFVKWNIYSGDNKWTISVFKGTPVNDIKQTIRDVTTIQNFICMNAESDIIVLTSYLPNDTNIYIQSLDIHTNESNDNNPITSDNSKNDNKNDDIKQDTPELYFDSKTIVTNDNHEISNDRLSFTEIGNKGWGGVMTNIEMKYPKKYIWSTIFSSFCCCYDKFYLINGSKLPKNRKFDYSTYNSASSGACIDISVGACIECTIRRCKPFKNHPRKTPYELIHVLDMEKREYWIFAKNHFEPMILLRNLPKDVIYFAVGIKHGIKCTIKGLNELDKNYDLHVTEDTKIKRLK